MKSIRFYLFLGITAVAAVTALLFPGAVLVGLFLGFLPGIFLSLATSLFIYLLVWRVVRWLFLHVLSSRGIGSTTRRRIWLANVAAWVIVAIPATAIPLVFNASLAPRIAELQASDVEASGPVTLAPTVALELPATYGEKFSYCEEICLRLLYNGAVTRVIAAQLRRDSKVELATSYRIERRADCPKPDFSRSSIVWPGEWQRVDGKLIAFRDRIRARIAAGDCLVREAGHLEDAEMIISLHDVERGSNGVRNPWNLWLDTLSARRLEVTTSDQRVLFRRTEVTSQPLAVPLRHVVATGLLTAASYSGWLRFNREASLLGPNARDVLPGLLGEASRPPDMAVLPDAR